MDATEDKTTSASSISLEMMLSCPNASKEEFVREYKLLYCEKSKREQLDLLVLTELEKAIAGDDIESLKKLINYTSDLDPIRSTNLIILATKHNRVEILEYLLDSDSKVLNNLCVGIGKDTISPKDEDESHHNAFYYAIRSENIQLLLTIITKWPNNYFAVHLEELEEILSKVYHQLKLKNVPLSDEMQVFVERKLIDLRFFSTEQNTGSPKTDDPNKILLKERIKLLLHSISLLKENYSHTRKVDGQFLFLATFIAQNIHLLKGRLSLHYDKIPWEEIEFCLATFVSSQTKLQELNLFYRAILNKRKILDYLESFANELSDVEKITESDKLHCIPRGKGNTRDEIVAKIIKDNPKFEKLYNDYHQIRDIYSLRRINDHIKLAISADVQEKQGQLVIVRVLQVIGEHLKSTLGSPKLSQNTKQLLELSLPQNAKDIITDLRDSISHADKLSKILEIEKKADVNFFINIQNDVKKVAEVITDILYENRIKTIRILLKKVQDSETLDEINEVLEELSTAKLDKTITKNFKTIEHGKIEKLIMEFSENIADKTNYEKELFKKLNNILNCSENETENIRSDYIVEFLNLRECSTTKLNYNNTDENLIRKIKECATNRLNKVTPTIKPNGFQEIVKLAKEIVRSVTSRKPSYKFEEVHKLTRKINYIVEFEIDDIKWIEELSEKLPKRIKNKIELTPEDLKLKLDQLESILSRNQLNKFKDDKNLQTVVKMLVLDIMVILDYEGCLNNNIHFLDVNTPLLHGKCLRNYLAHDNAVVDVLLSDPLLAIILNAEKLTKEKNIMESTKKIGKLVSDDHFKIKNKKEKQLKKKNAVVDVLPSDPLPAITLNAEKLTKEKNIIESNIKLVTDDPVKLKKKKEKKLKKNNAVVEVLPSDPLPAITLNAEKLTKEKNIIESNIKLVSDDPVKLKKKKEKKLKKNNAVVDVLPSDPSPAIILNAETLTKENNIIESNKKIGKLVSDDPFKLKKNFEQNLNIIINQERMFVASPAIILNAETLTKENNIIESNKKIGKLVRDDPFKLKKNFEQNLNIIINQERMFVALEEGDSDVLWDCLNKGADIKARSTINAWTTLHFAAKGSSLEVIKFILEQNLNVGVKDNSGQTPLHIAASHGRQDIVEFLLEEAYACVDDPDIRDITPLHVATQKGHKNIVEVLLKYKANISAEDESGCTPLYYAIRNNRVDVVKVLLERDLNFDINEAMGGSTALHLAASDGYLELVMVLLRKGAHINDTTDENLVPLHLAAFNGHLAVVDTLIHEGAIVNTSEINGFMPLHCAIYAGNVEMVKSLLKHGAFVNTAAATPLHLASECGNLEIVAALLEHDADIHAKFNHNTALHHAAGSGQKKVVGLLIEKGADVNTKGDNNLSALHEAVTNGHKDIAQLLIDKQAEVNAETTSGSTAMHMAASKGNKDIMELLEKNKAKVNARRLNGVTPLHEAVKEGHKAAVDFLIECEAEVNARNNDGLTPLYVAVLLGNKEIVQLLIDNGALVNVRIIGDSIPPPLHTAAMGGHKEIAEILIDKGAIVDDIKSYKLTPLHCAIDYNQKEIVKLLLQKGAKVDLANFADWSLPVVRRYTDIVKILLETNEHYATHKVSESYTLLHLAVKMGHKKIVKALITSGAAVDAILVNNITPLMCAVEEGFEEIVDILIAHKAEVNLIYSQGNAPLDVAVRKGHSKVVKVLLDNNANIDNNDNRNIAPILRLAVASGHLEVVKILLQHMKVNINAQDTDGFTLLHIASQTKTNFELVKYLVDEGSDINAQIDGYKAIHLAARYGCKETVEFFVRKGISINELGENNHTLLHCAVGKGQLEIVNYLIDQHADVNAKSTNGFTPVHGAAIYGSADVIEVLLKNGATYNAVNNFYKTPLEVADNKDVIKLLKSTDQLFQAVKSSNSSEVQSCMESGAIVNAKSAEGLTPLHYAALKGYDEIVKILLQNKANLNVRSNKGFTPLHYAAKLSHLKVVKVLLSYYAVYNAVTDSGKTPSDLTVDNSIISLFKLISDSFKNIKIGNCQVINDLDKIDDIDTIKAIMCARNDTENQTLVVAALHSNFSKIQQLQHTAQGDITNQICNAVNLLGLEEYQKALCILEGAVKKKREILGPDDPTTFHIQKIIIDVLIKQGDYQEALKLAEEIFQKEKKLFGLNNNLILKTRTMIATILLNQGKDEEALNIFKEVYRKQKKMLGPKNAENLMIQTHMGLALERLEKYDEALNMFTSVCQNTDPANYEGLLHAQQNKAMVLANKGNDEEALEMFNETLKKTRKDLGNNHPITMTVLFNIAVLTGKKKKYNKALTMYYEILDNQKRLLKPNHPKILRTQYNIACTLFFQRKWIHSRQVFQEGFHQRKAIFGENHPIVLDIIRNIKAINFNLKLQGKTPSKIHQFLQKNFIVAADTGDIKTIKSLLQDGAIVDNKDIHGRTALHYAVSNGYVDVVNMLLEYEADITEVTMKGNTPLHIATSKNYKKIVEILLQHLGPDKLNDYINAKTTGSGATALHVSAQNGFLDITVLLLKRGAIYNIKNNEGKTPLDLCKDENVTNLLQLIEGLFEEAKSGNEETIPKLKEVKPEYEVAVENARNNENLTILQAIIMNKFQNVAVKHLGMLKGLPDMTIPLKLTITDKR